MEEAEGISDAMIENPHFTVVCSEAALARLSLAFKAKGYLPDKDLDVLRLSYSSDQPNLYGCIFIPSDANKGLKKEKL